ncbi:Protocadherin-1 [Schistosoma japonicum]|uniref:Protocadherin-1 n=1 Tax=Schistosoma japonicum TaxID=6182 RepID=A0A4Z2DW29_SCHJA|nr:Protocadherin-1 [Schistosoma japonicum]
MLPLHCYVIIFTLQTKILILFTLMFSVKTNFITYGIRLLHTRSLDSSLSSSSSSSLLRTSRSTLNVYTVNFMLPDELPHDHYIGNIPKNIPNFPFLNILDSSVSTTLIDSSGFILQLFRVTDNGDFYTQTLIDRDNPDHLCGPLNCCHLIVCNLTVDVLFFHPATESIKVHVNLQIHDANDNSPYFAQQTFSLWIPEDNRLKYSDLDIQNMHKTIYALPLATDADSAPNGVVQYRIHGSIPATSTFQIYSNLSSEKLGLLIKPGVFLDYDNANQRIFKLIIEAIDGGHPARTGRMLVLVHITDVNDNIPTFRISKDSISLPENTKFDEPVYKVQAKDADSDDNGLIKYTFSLVNPNIPSSVMEKFTFHSTTGELYLRDVLDYETFQERQIDLIFTAYDTGDPPLSATTQLTIYLQDINDNPPQLIVQINNTIKENSEPGQLALRLQIRDKDEVSRDKISCHSDHSNYQVPLKMSISRDKTMITVITTASVDYELTPKLYYTITCLDEASPKQMRQFNLTISIGDVNDNPPKFKTSTFAPKIGHYKILLSEAEPINQLVLIVTAEDADSGDNGRISYSLTDIAHNTETSHFNGVQYFKIDSQTGSIFLMKQLDYEQNDLLHFKVLAEDNPKPTDGIRMSAIATVIVQVLDVNDNGPRLISSDTLSLVEHSPIGTDLGLLKFTDPDTGPGGQIAHISLIDSLSITKINEKYSIQNKCNRLHKSIHYFKLNDNGHLISIQSIDREECSTIFLPILAIDRGLPNPMTSTTTLTIHILDINDNIPIIEKPKLGETLTYQPIKLINWDSISFYQLTSKHDKILNHKLLNSTYLKQNVNNKMSRRYIYARIAFQIHANDLDAGENGRITYQQNTSCNGSKYFHLDENSGEFRARFIDYQKLSTPELIESDSRRGIYHLCVQMTDNGKPPLQTTTWFYVKVIDPIMPPSTHNIWPADSANDIDLLFTNFYNSTNPLWSSHLLDASKSDSLHLPMDMNISNIVISILLVIFAITIVCTLTAAILWARSKHRFNRMHAKKGKSGCINNDVNSDSNKNISKLKFSRKNKKHEIKRGVENVPGHSKSMHKRLKHNSNICNTVNQIYDKNKCCDRCSSISSNETKIDASHSLKDGSLSEKLTDNLGAGNKFNYNDSNKTCDQTNEIRMKSPKFPASIGYKNEFEKNTFRKKFSTGLFQRNKPTNINGDNNYVALNKLHYPTTHSVNHQHLLHEYKQVEDNTRNDSENSYLLPCDLISVCTKHNRTDSNNNDNNGHYTIDTGETPANCSSLTPQPTSPLIKHSNDVFHHHHYRQNLQPPEQVTPSNQQQGQVYSLGTHFVSINPNNIGQRSVNTICPLSEKKLDFPTDSLSGNMITCCSTIPIVSTLSRGCPTHGPHLILHHDEHSNFSTPTRIYAVSSVLESFGTLTTTITTATTSTTNTKTLTDQTQTTYELRFEPILSDVALTTTKTDLTTEDGSACAENDDNEHEMNNTETISWIPVSILTENISAPMDQTDYICNVNN